MQDIFPFATNQVHDLVFHFFDHGAIHIDLIDHRNDLQIVLNRQVKITDGLGLDTLGGINQQKTTFAGGQCPAYFITEIHVAGCIDQVQDILLPVGVFIINLDGMTFNRNPLFPFEIHIIQYLVHHITVADGTGAL